MSRLKVSIERAPLCDVVFIIFIQFLFNRSLNFSI